jgi:hypothetical protein
MVKCVGPPRIAEAPHAHCRGVGTGEPVQCHHGCHGCAAAAHRTGVVALGAPLPRRPPAAAARQRAVTVNSCVNRPRQSLLLPPAGVVARGNQEEQTSAQEPHRHTAAMMADSQLTAEELVAVDGREPAMSAEAAEEGVPPCRFGAAFPGLAEADELGVRFEDEGSLGLDLVEQPPLFGVVTVAIAALKRGTQAMRHEALRLSPHPGSGVKPGLVLVSVGGRDVRGAGLDEVIDVISAMGARPLACAFIPLALMRERRKQHFHSALTAIYQAHRPRKVRPVSPTRLVGSNDDDEDEEDEEEDGDDHDHDHDDDDDDDHDSARTGRRCLTFTSGHGAGHRRHESAAGVGGEGGGAAGAGAGQVRRSGTALAPLSGRREADLRAPLQLLENVRAWRALLSKPPRAPPSPPPRPQSMRWPYLLICVGLCFQILCGRFDWDLPVCCVFLS